MAGLRVRKTRYSFVLYLNYNPVPLTLIVVLSVVVDQAIGYEFDYNDYHRCSSMTVLAISSQGNTLACTQFWYIFVAEIRTSFGEPCKIKSVLMEFMLCCGLQVGTSRRIKGADHALESIHNMKEAFPELWEEGEKSELVLHSGKIGLETSAIA
ncbi:hypothetical protein BHE74_00022000 [Ensete ventricosum]|nr:hypothetical protein GW17_00009917 [Ensete ventricosum]RWW70319.1 hypothetical protein BHE74_00022000 [Ensete ventricosum]